MIKFYLLVLGAAALLLPGIILSQQPLRGQRPSLDLSKIPVDACIKGKLNIKFKPAAVSFLRSGPAIKNGSISFGNSQVDELNRKFSVKGAKRVFEKVLQEQQYEARHKAWGLQLWYELELPDSINIVEAVKAYSSLGMIEVAEPQYKKVLYDQFNTFNWSPSDPQYVNQWHYNNTGQQGGTIDADIDLPEAWDIQKGNPNVIVAVVDGGIDTTHPDLRPNLWIGAGERFGYNFVSNSDKITPDDHGSHTSGTIAAVNNNSVGVSGIAGGNGTANSGVKLMSCQVFSASSSASSFAAAYIYSADRGAAISQNSWGYTVAGTYEQSVLDAIDYFIQYGGGSVLNGGIVIFSLGNNNAYERDYPGAYHRVISVAATNNMDQRAWYSTYGQWADISAPGGETNVTNARGILSTVRVSNGSYAYMQGTSMACPQVSGVAALIISQAPGRLTNDDVKSILLTTTDNHYPVNPSFTDQLGTGRLNAFKALIKTNQLIADPAVGNIADFTISSTECNRIDLSWAKNAANNDVMIAVATDKSNVFGIPSGSYAVGDNITGGGKIIYKGNANNFSWTDALLDSVYYYFKIWSVNATRYSAGIVNFIVKNESQSPVSLFEAIDGDCLVGLSWAKSETCPAAEVIVTMNSTNSFGCPSGNLTVGNQVPGGGTVIYRGTGTSFNHTGPGDSSSAYYAIWAASSGIYSVIPRVVFGSTRSYLKTFNATAVAASQVNLDWSYNSCFNGNVLVAFSSSNTFGNPSGNYSTGNNINGGGTVLYVGPLLNFNHINLAPASTYSYKIWPIIASGVYGTGKTKSVITPCGNGTLPLPVTDMFSTINYNSCRWDTVFVTQAGGLNRPQLSIVAAGDFPTINPVEGSYMIKFNSFDCNDGAQVRLVSKPIVTGGNGVDVMFRWYHDNSAFTGANFIGEGVKLQWSVNGTNWNTFDSVDRTPPAAANSSGWYYKQATLPAAALTNPQIRIGFLFTSKFGDNCYLDSIGIFNTRLKPTNGLVKSAVSEYTDASGWTHYHDNDGERLLSIRKNGNAIGYVNQAGFNLIVGGNNGFSIIANTGNNYVTNAGGWRTMNRYYDLTPATEPVTDCNIRFYYNASDSVNLKEAALTLTPPIGAVSNFVFNAYKINKIVTAYDLDPANGHLNIPRASSYNQDGFWQYGIGTSPSSANWSYGNMGGSMRYAEYLVKHFGGGGIGIGGAGQGALPIKWLSFTGRLINDDVAELQWKVTEEIYVRNYEVEMSRDGTTFSKIATMTALPGNSSNTYTYNYTLAESGNYFFRIKQKDFDDKFSYSGTVRLSSSKAGRIVIMPNPARNYFEIKGCSTPYQLNLLDASGKTVRSFIPSANNIYSLEGLSKGTYVLKLIITGKIEAHKLVIE